MRKSGAGRAGWAGGAGRLPGPDYDAAGVAKRSRIMASMGLT
jgi:hypothetical protein